MGRLCSVGESVNQVNSVQVAGNILSVVCGCETRLIVISTERKLEAFHMSCHRWITWIRWFDHVTSVVRRDGRSSPVILQTTYGGLWTCSSTTGGGIRSAGTTADCWHDLTTIVDHDIPGSVRCWWHMGHCRRSLYDPTLAGLVWRMMMITAYVCVHCAAFIHDQKPATRTNRHCSRSH